MDLSQKKLSLKIAETKLLSNSISNEERDRLRIRVTIFKHQIEELENQSLSLRSNAKITIFSNPWAIINNPSIIKIGSLFKTIWSYIIIVITGLIIAYFTHWFGWNN